jgi:hypothetical protein
MADKNGVRRAQLIAPFGVGALSVMKDATSLICGGLDYWFQMDDESRNFDLDEFRLEEWRLQRRLRVDHFRMPPDHRRPLKGQDQTNTLLTVPFLRFPLWHLCPRCDYLKELPPSRKGFVFCERCLRTINKRIRLSQVHLVAACDHGHLQDFPWREWAHRTAAPSCQRDMRLLNLGGASLTSLIVLCDCGEKRTLYAVTAGDQNSSRLSETLAPKDEEPFLCKGQRPWFGTDEAQPCNRPLQAAPRNATNVYFAKTMSAIYIPQGNGAADPELVELLAQPPLSTLVNALHADPSSLSPTLLRSQQPILLKQYSDAQLNAAIQVALEGKGDESSPPSARDGDENRFRHEEYAVIREPQDQTELLVRRADLEESDFLRCYFSNIALLHKLRETRVLTGFSRLSPGETSEDYRERMNSRQSLLWRKLPPPTKRWLPAVKVYGEGIYLEFDEKRLKAWEQSPEVQDRVRPLAQRNYEQSAGFDRLGEVTPRFVLIHTFAHLLMTQLTFTSGYSAASLRERLFVSSDPQTSMAGVLIYTAAGDSEGTLGGLVRLGKPVYLERVVQEALEFSRWCSSDPVCMEAGGSGGQGPRSLNLAACHGCALVPETACEEFNRFLDRALVIGDLGKPGLGYFST